MKTFDYVSSVARKRARAIIYSDAEAGILWEPFAHWKRNEVQRLQRELTDDFINFYREVERWKNTKQ